jgi:hypothetical protein
MQAREFRSYVSACVYMYAHRFLSTYTQRHEASVSHTCAFHVRFVSHQRLQRRNRAEHRVKKTDKDKHRQRHEET